MLVPGELARKMLHHSGELGVWRRPMGRKQTGFSLIELLIVVAIIMIIAAIALPSLLSARISANEASAVQSLRTIQTSETEYATTYPNFGYSATLADLGGARSSAQRPLPTPAGLVDNPPAPATR